MGVENLEVLKIEELEENLEELKNWITKEERDKFLKHFRNTTGNGELKFKTPKKNDIFNAFKIGKDENTIKPEDVRVLIIGQDPYPEETKAHGYSFSVLQDYTKKHGIDASLDNIFKAISKYIDKEYDKDEYKNYTNLSKWAKNNGILLLNTALTFKQNEKHFNIWKPFIEQIITKLFNAKNHQKLAIFLWGKPAQQLFYSCLQNTKYNQNFLNKLGSDNSNKIKTKKLVKHEDGIEINNSIKIFLTNHPSFLSENNKKYGGKFIEYSSKKNGHFQSCDKFIGEINGKYIWKDFPENNK